MASRYWFPAKRYGFGWGPPTRWQGWAVLVAYFGLFIADSFVFPPKREPGLFAGGAWGLTLLLLAIIWIRGEPPRWRWGRGGRPGP